ncbi:MAG: OsmC family protein [Hyphomonadaceae bacterium]|nr:MAG: OsmC family protein [Caulobacteraceae bacterium]MBT9445881.1 OsmC family protein [Hyphomonadaceae bacterium]TPW08545.1 MAG: OsmC family protein [Alphaproteobacteria bacterium]
MSDYTATVTWARDGAVFTDGKYSRTYLISFDGGVSIAGSASPHVVRAPLSKADAADPEELLVAAVSSCHMLFFLDFARRGGFTVDRYQDEAVGVMEKDDRGRTSITKVTLRPAVSWSGEKQPSPEDIDDLNHRAHEACYIANSIRAEVLVEART